MAIISAIGFMAVVSIVTAIVERIMRGSERRKDKAAVQMIRDHRHIHAAG